jgi:hypothetical protein
MTSTVVERHGQREAPLSEGWAGLMRSSFSSAREGAAGGSERWGGSGRRLFRDVLGES